MTTATATLGDRERLAARGFAFAGQYEEAFASACIFPERVCLHAHESGIS